MHSASAAMASGQPVAAPPVTPTMSPGEWVFAVASLAGFAFQIIALIWLHRNRTRLEEICGAPLSGTPVSDALPLSPAEEVVRRARAPRVGRRFLGLPFWLWPLASALLIVWAVYVPHPGELAEPKDAANIFRYTIYFTPEGGWYRAVDLADVGKFKNVYGVNLLSEIHQSVTRTFGWPPQNGTSLGFFHRSASWKYQLSPNRMGTGDAPAFLPPEEREKLRPWVEQQLQREHLERVQNARDKLDPSLDENRATLFVDLLNNGRRVETFACWQNLVVLLAWLSLPFAAIAVLRILWSACFGKSTTHRKE